MIQVATHFDTAKHIIDAKRFLAFEAAALKQLEESLDDSFPASMLLIQQTKGRCIVTGMGKSGHVARKMAATLSSTGTPAFFVHPGEASHGDLGMISQEDVVIALSNSGETIELLPVIAYCKRYQIPLIAITGGRDSTLAQAATHVLLIPKLREACPIGLAPTTSTTMMMALGDALASCLLKQNHFSPEDFSIFHPGGALGKKLKTTGEIMHVGTEIPLLPQSAPMQEALIEMTSKRFGCVGIVNEQSELVGIITDGDLRRHMGENLLSLSVSEVMTHSPLTLHKQALIEEAIALMQNKKITSLFITEKKEKRPVGIINIHDCLRVN